MVATEKSDAQKHAAQRSAPDGLVSTQSAHLKKKDERNPDRAVHHLRPIGQGKVAAEGEDQTGGERSGPPATKVAAEEIGKARGHEVDDHVIPVEVRRVDVAAGER